MLDKKQFNQLYQYCYSLTGDRTAAFDLLQSGLEKYLKAAGNTQNNLPYIRKIIRNHFIDQLRRDSRASFEQIENNSAVDIESHTLEHLVIQEDTLEKLWQQLTAPEREILYLWAVLGCTTDEIARLQDCPKGTVLSRIHRLRKKLQTKLHPDRQQLGGQPQ